MRTLYKASDGIEAQLLVDVLASEGIEARIEGEHLQGAIGELPAAGLVRLTVDEADHARARLVIERWEASAAHSPPELANPRRKLSWGFLGFWAGLVIGIGGSFLYFQAPATSDGVDYNGDGVLDERFAYSAAGLLLKIESDRNFDDKVDSIIRYDRQGLIQSSEADDDFNGTMESRSRYWRGNAQTTEVDTDGDGTTDLRAHLFYGVVESVDTLNPTTGLPLRVEHFHLGKLIRAEIDTNEDGQLDTRETYDWRGRMIGSESIAR